MTTEPHRPTSREYGYRSLTFQTRPHRRGVDRDTGLTPAELTHHQRLLRAAFYARQGQQHKPQEGTR